MNILIISGAGFLRSGIARTCVAAGHRVRVFTRPTRSVARLEDILDQVEVAHGDFMDDHAIGEPLAGMDAVVHSLSTTLPKTVIASAAYDVMSNLLPTIRLVDYCLRLGIRNITYLPSGARFTGKPSTCPSTRTTRAIPSASMAFQNRPSRTTCTSSPRTGTWR